MNERTEQIATVVSGERYDMLTALEVIGIFKDQNVWLCQCQCGNTIKVLECNLKRHIIHDCGCQKSKGRKRDDITGQRFGRLVARKYEFEDQRRQSCWLFECDCGTTKVLPASSVRWNNVQSCGCLRAEKVREINLSDITQNRFGRLTACWPTELRDAAGAVIWQCRCDCGNVCLVSVSALRKGMTKSCGCYYQESRNNCDNYRRDKVESTNLSQLVSAKRQRASNSSGVTGVHYIKRLGKWEAYISFQKKRYYLGVYFKKEDAVKVRKEAEEKLHDPIIDRYIECLTEQSRQHYREYKSDE